MADRRWWRVEVSATGKVLSCVAVESAGDENRWFYVQAASAELAAKAAINAHCARLLAARRARYRAEGLCDCGRIRDNTTFVSCARCLERSRIHRLRYESRQRGEDVLPLDRRKVLLERKEAESASLRLAVLLEVQQAWQDLPTNGSFTRWLTEQIATARGRKVA
jgi:hypothetical protein